MTFVGRARVLELLRSALAGALEGRGRLVLISGEPGISKSTLMAALAAEAAASGIGVSSVRAPEAAGAPPYWLWTRTLGDEMRAVLQSKPRSKASAEPVFARILPELAAPYRGRAQAPSEANEAERFRLADEIASLLLSKAAESGRVVVLDDLHSADASSLEVLAHLASRLDPSRLLIIGAHRGAPDDLTPALQSMLGQVSRHETTLRIALPAFDVDAVRIQLAGVVGRDVDSKLATRVHARTGANPFFTARSAA